MALCELSFPAGGADETNLSVRWFEVQEGLSMLFEVGVIALSPNAALDFEGIVGKPARFSLDGGDLGERAYAGIVLGAELLDVEEDGLSTYRVTIVPRAWLLTQRTNHRIFQHQSVPEIAQTVLGEWNVAVEQRLSRGRYPKLEYRVQYGETDFHFLSRMLEEAGIHYFFEQAGDESRLVLCDAPERAEAKGPPLPWMDNPGQGARTRYASSLSLSTQMRPGKTTVRDFDFRRPDYALAYKFEAPGSGEEQLEVYRYAPGQGRINLASPPGDSPAGDDRSAARIDEHEGYASAERGLSGARADRRSVTFASNDLGLAPGKALTIRNHPKAAFREGRKLIVTSIELEGSPDRTWDIAATALFADEPIRSAQKTPKPIISGPQSAIVVGPEGSELHTDEFGRVRVRFPWDRGGKFDDQRTCWLRVAEGAAGAGFGMSMVPRVGHEVIVEFYEGNPDEPVIVGRLYDTTQPPPYGLPNKRTKSGWKSQSTPGGEGYNEISFDDAFEHEMLTMRAEKDLHKSVLHDEREDILRDQTMMVGRDRITNVKQLDSITAGAVHSVQMGQVTKAENVAEGAMADVALGETLREMIPGRITLSTGGATIQLDGPNVIITAESDVVLKAGGELKIWGGPYVQINPPHVAKSGDASKSPADPKEVVWFQLTSADGSPMPDVVCRVSDASGEASVQRTDGNGLVRFPAASSGEYQLTVGAPSPKAQARMDGAAPAQMQLASASAQPAPTRGVEVGATSAQVAGRARPTTHAVPLELEVITPAPRTAYEIDPGRHPSPDPSMPTVALEAKVKFQGQPVTIGTLTWEFWISGEYRVRQERTHRLQQFRYSAGTVQTTPGQKLDYRLTPGEIVGGDLTVTVTYQSGPELGDLRTTKTVNQLKVVGKNPTREDVLGLVREIGGTQAWILVRMFCHESEHTLGQFRNGEVRYGPPSGVGTVQRDPVEGEWVWPAQRLTQPNNFFPRIFWDWKKNVREGVEKFRSDYMNRGRRSLAELRRKNPLLPEPTEDLVIRAAIRAYNGGHEYQASPDGRQYVVQPHRSRNGDGSVTALADDRLPYVNQVLDDPHVDAATYPVPPDVRAQSWPVRRR